MKTFSVFVVLLIGASAVAESPRILIYNNDLVFIQQYLKLKLTKGKSEISQAGISRLIDLASVKLRFGDKEKDIRILEQGYRYRPLELELLLELNRGNEVKITTRDNITTISGTLLGYDSAFVFLKAGDERETGSNVLSISRESIQDIKFPGTGGNFDNEPVLHWILDSDTEGNADAELTYLSGGLSWTAEYLAEFNEKAGELKIHGNAKIVNNTGLDFKDVMLRLLAGSVHQVPEIMARNMPRPMMAMADQSMAEGGAAMKEQEFEEYHLYTLPRSADILRDETKLLSLFDEKTLKPQKVFTYEGGEDVRVEYVFKNSREAGPGVPLPAGVVKIFSSGTEEGMLAFIGEDRIKHIPVDEEVRVSTGNAFDLRGERREMERVRISKNEYRESYEIELRNRKSEDVEIVVVEHPSGDWKITSSSLPYVKKSKDRIEFKVRVPKGDTVILSYSLETRW